jgi:hypothetical protein
MLHFFGNWALGIGRGEKGKGKRVKGKAQCPMTADDGRCSNEWKPQDRTASSTQVRHQDRTAGPNAQCPMPNALCPMPNSPFPFKLLGIP